MSDTQESNPYNGSRDHETPKPMDRDDMMAVAGLLGTVSGALNEIDKKNVGGANQFVQARKLDPKQALQNIITSNQAYTPQQALPPQPVHQSPPPPVASPPSETTQQIQSQVPQQNVDVSELEKRVRELEVIVSSYKKIEKFKRGVGYKIVTSKISGEFKEPSTIMDVISTEIAKNTKTITLKLIDATTKSKKQE